MYVGRYSDVVVARDTIRLYQAGLGRYAPTREPSSALESIQPALESTAQSDAFSALLSAAALADLRTRSFGERMRWPDPSVPLPALTGAVPDRLRPEQLQRTASYFADLRENRGQPQHELRPGELPAPRTHHPLRNFDDVMQAVSWHERRRGSAAQALREGQLHEPPDGHDHISPSGTASYMFSSRGGSIDSILSRPTHETSIRISEP